MERLPIPISLKRQIKYHERPEIPENELEIDHIIPVSEGGTNDRENLMALTLIEHATKHYQRGEMDAVNLIVAKMTKTEFIAWCVVRRTL